MARVFLIVIDSVGAGGAPDADAFFNGDVPDTGSNTIAHIAQACAAGLAEEGRSGPLKVGTLDAMGMGAAVRMASGDETPGMDAIATGAWGAATEISIGKDTPSGHWELAGVPVPWDWHTFPKADPCFPADIVAEVCRLAGTDGILGNRHASGTLIIESEAEEHMKNGWPICYTSVDSVFQIAAHEETFGLERLLDLCRGLAPMLHEMKVGRVIARPFIGNVQDGFERTPHRRDFAIDPPSPTLCDWISDAGKPVYAIGKIGDIFSMHGIDEVRKGRDTDLMGHLNDLVDEAKDGALIFANFVEFDSLFGHRRDVSGYAKALEWFNIELSKILPRLRPDDILMITADHGNDPTWTGTDHTRERVPVLIHGLGARELGHFGFVDVAASVATYLGVTPRGPGKSFL